MRRFYERFLSIRKIPVPTIAALNGPAVGAGMCVACACDVRVASATAKLGFPFVDLGIHPGMGSTHFLPLLVGHEQAFTLLSTGVLLSGTKAHAIGLVGEVVGSEEMDHTTNAAAVMARAMELALQFASKPQATIRTLTRSMRMRHETDLDRALWREADAQAQCYAAPGFKTALEEVQARVQKGNK